MISLVVKIYCSLFESRMITRVPADTKHIAVISYLGANFSPRNFTEMYTLKSTAVDELQAIRVRSANGSAKKCPKKPTPIRHIPHMPLNVQKSDFEIVSSEDVVYFFFSSSRWAVF